MVPDAFHPEDLALARLEMVRTQIAARGVRDPLVLSAMRTVPRHEFVDRAAWAEAYADRPLPLAGGQTISQPYMVACMTELCALKGGEHVLEIGTGSGYQAAVLAEIAARVYTMEILEPLLRTAAAALHRLQYHNIVPRFGDGSGGWAEAGPFDAIVLTAAPAEVPPALGRQLREGGRLVAPVGRGRQRLRVFERRGRRLRKRDLMAVRFVPMTGEAGL
ncbi:MAG: protein-L-isoaspartate(D-aspartate) O-methyltransferase [Planctomycetota bacterium]|nr:protein-L-isoaspartate(D-aspartate) O-methyltransferase [Planctomycetota bacterium]